MRKAIMGLGGVLIIVGLVELILVLVLVGGLKSNIEGIDVVMEDATSALTEVADTLDGAADYLGDLDATLADVEEPVGDLTDAVASTQDTTIDVVTSAQDMITDTVTSAQAGITDALTSAQDAAEEWFEQFEVEITSDDFYSIALVIDNLGLDARAIRDEAGRLRREALVYSVTAEDATEAFTFIIDSLEPVFDSVIDSLEPVFDGVIDSLEPVFDGIIDSLEPVSDGISGAREFLVTLQTDLSDIGDDLGTMSEDIEEVDIGGTANGVIGWLQTYMILSSILFMATGAGLFLVGIRRTEA